MTFTTIIPSHLQSKRIRCSCSFILLHHPSVSLPYSSPSLLSSFSSALSSPSPSFLVHKRSHHKNRPSIGIPGGRIENGETAEMAAQREVWQQVGLWIPTEKFLLLGIVIEDFYAKYNIIKKKNNKYNNNNNTYSESYGKYYFFEVFLTPSDLHFERIDNRTIVDPSFGLPHYNHHSFITLKEFFSFKYQHLIAKGLLDLYQKYTVETKKKQIHPSPVTPTQKNKLLLVDNNNNNNSNTKIIITENKTESVVSSNSSTPPMAINEVGQGFLSIPIPAPQPLSDEQSFIDPPPPAPRRHRERRLSRPSPPQRFRFSSADIARGHTASKPLVVDHWTTFPPSKIQLWNKSKLIMEKFFRSEEDDEENDEQDNNNNNNNNNTNMQIEISKPSTAPTISPSLAPVPLHHHLHQLHQHHSTSSSAPASMDTCTPASSPASSSLSSNALSHHHHLANFSLHPSISIHDLNARKGSLLTNHTSSPSLVLPTNNHYHHQSSGRKQSSLVYDHANELLKEMCGSVASVLDLNSNNNKNNNNKYPHDNNNNNNNNQSKSPTRFGWSEHKESSDSSSPSKYGGQLNYSNYYPMISGTMIPPVNHHYQQPTLFIRRDIPFLNIVPMADTRHYYH